MCNRLAFLVCVSFVLAAFGAGIVQGEVPTPNVLWWQFDEGQGDVATDSSGNGRDGIITGAEWKAGGVGGVGSCLEFFGTGQIVEDEDAGDYLNELEAVTVAMWIKADAVPTDKGFLNGEPPDGGDNIFTMRYDAAGATGGGSSLLKMAVVAPGDEQQLESSSGLQTTEWQHVCMTWARQEQLAFYADGALDTPVANGAPRDVATSDISTLIVGQGAKDDGGGWDGLIDDVRIYDYVLTAGQIAELYEGDKPRFPKAGNPSPANGETGVITPLFQWSAGDTAQFHDVYLGTSPDLGPGDLRQPRSPMTLYFHVPGLTPGTTYYWRVDEIEADMTTVHTGDVWTFTAAPVTAFEPAPRDEGQWVDPDADLSWRPGAGAVSHDVYFGTDETAVAEGTGDTFKGNQFVMIYELDTLAADTTHYWRVDELDAAGNKQTGEVWSFTVVGAGGGAKGEYWANMALTGDPTVTRVDPAIDFDWGNGTEPGTNSPDASIPVDQFSCRWMADLQVDHAETYTLITTSDDGVRLWLDGALVVDNWTNHSATDNRSDPLDLVPGRFYSLKMEHYEDGGGAVAQLSWMSNTDERAIIPRGPLQPPLHAQMPSPPNGAVDVPQDVVLSWVAGDQATAHQVIFGDEEDTVANATGGTQQALANTTYSPGILEWGKTYYWRIDEVGPAGPGSVWSFTTADFIIVEDFEGYDDADNRIYLTWIDGVDNGTGSYVGYAVAVNGTFGETVIVYGGGQSMPLEYDNSVAPFYSETDRTFGTPRDWTVNGVDALVLYVRGDRSNDAEPLYVGIEDSSGTLHVVVHPDPRIALVGMWGEWKIPLSEFSNAGVNLTAVKKMYIGLGNRNAPTPGGAGLIFVDEIRVTRP